MAGLALEVALAGHGAVVLSLSLVKLHTQPEPGGGGGGGGQTPVCVIHVSTVLCISVL